MYNILRRNLGNTRDVNVVNLEKNLKGGVVYV
jgi:hypothetical protein